MSESDQLDINDLVAEIARIHVDLAATGSTPLVAELAQARLVIPQLRRRLAQWEQQATTPAAPAPSPDA